MARRRMRSGWLLVALATLALSVSLVVSETPILQRSEPVTVGTSRFGDVAVYDTFIEWQNGEGGSVDDRRDQKLVWSVHGPNLTAHTGGELYPAVGLTADVFDPTLKRGYDNSITTMWIDMETREPLRREYYAPATFQRAIGTDPGVEDVDMPSYTVTENHTVVRYFALWNPLQIQDGYQPAYLLTFLQGKTLRLGDDVGAPIVEPLTSWTVCCPGERYDFSMKVGREGMHQGRRVVGVDMYAHELYRLDGSSSNPGPVEYASWANATFWFEDGSAYPVRLDWDYTEWWTDDQGAPVWNYVRGSQWLIDARLGTRTVDWGEFRPRGVPSREPTVAPGPMITTGARNPLPYALEAAQAAIDADATLLSYRLWKLQHPAAQVTGVHFGPVPDDPTGGHAWTIAYGEIGGNTVFTVRSLFTRAGTSVNQVVGETNCGPKTFRETDLPYQVITIADLDAIWRLVAPPEVTRQGANVLGWGLVTCSPTAVFTLKSAGYGRVMERDGSAPLTRERQNSVIFVNAQTGELTAAIETDEKASNSANVPLALSAQPAAPAAGRSAPSPVSNVAIAGAGISLMLLFAYLYPILHQGAFTLYSKLVKHQLLDHELRDQLIHLIRENPGISPPMLKSLTNSAWTTVIYHLSVLSENNLITSVRDGRHRRYFPVGAIHHQALPKLALLQNPRTKEVRDMILAQPGIERATIARMLGVTPAAATWHLRRLVTGGLIRSEKHGKLVRYYGSAALPMMEAVMAPA